MHAWSLRAHGRDTSAVPPRSETGVSETGLDLLTPLRADPAHTAIFSDIDGTLAPIVDRPEHASVPTEATQLLKALGERFGLVGCVSGRQALEAQRLVGAEGIAYAGNHGLELLLPGEQEPRPTQSLQGQEDHAARFIAALGDEVLGGAELRLEDKGPIQALHWRSAEDEHAAEAGAHAIAAEARRAGLEPHWGRKVLELRPVGGGDKGDAITALLAAGDLTAAAYAGDDRTDLDAFRRLRELRDQGELGRAVCIAISSPEAPPELAEEADLSVDGPWGWLKILEFMAQ
jgi:trehalose 6-phosphate phosphatase